MDYKTQDAILREAEKLTDEFIKIVWRTDESGNYTLCAVVMVDLPTGEKDYLTNFGTPWEVWEYLHTLNEENAKAAAMFPDKSTEYQAELIAANID